MEPIIKKQIQKCASGSSDCWRVENNLSQNEIKRIYKNRTTIATAVSDTLQHRFKSNASTKQPIPLKINAFHLTKNGEPRPNESGRAGDMAEMRKIANICPLF